jgi:glycosyltransferase involved in cell wall biosynthesis
MPTLSVIVPNYNHAIYLPDCLDALLGQSLQPDEILIIDDASTDASLDVIAPYIKAYPHIRLVRNIINKGVVNTVNDGLKLISGNYVAFCSADDIVLPGFFSSSMSFLARCPDLALCVGDPSVFKNIKPYHFKYSSPNLGKVSRIIEPQGLASILRRRPFWIPSHATIYKTSCVLEFGGFDLNLKHVCDWLLNYQIAFKYPIGYIPQPHASIRALSESYGLNLRRQKKVREDVFAYLLERIEGSELRNSVLNSGLLAQHGVLMLLFLLKNPPYWKFFPFVCLKKLQFFLNKHV